MSHCEITDQYLDKLYDDCLREEARLLNSLRTSSDMELDDRSIQREAQLLHSIASNALKLKLCRKKSRAKLG
jgi:hypothetical protein